MFLNLNNGSCNSVKNKTFRITNSDINGEKAVAILKSLLKHDVRILEFSNCEIGNKGMIAVAKFILEVPLVEILLSNNQIGKYVQ